MSASIDAGLTAPVGLGEVIEVRRGDEASNSCDHLLARDVGEYAGVESFGTKENGDGTVGVLVEDGGRHGGTTVDETEVCALA